MFINKEKLLEEAKKYGEPKKWGHGEDNLTYSISEIFYEMYRDDNNKEVGGHSDMAEYALKHYGIIPAFIVLVRDYIGQVNNGGHMQYYDNGYASWEGGGFGSGTDLELHDMLLAL